MLAWHPCHRFIEYIIKGLYKDFRIGADRSQPARLTTNNMPSAFQHQCIVTDYLDKEGKLDEYWAHSPTVMWPCT